MRVQALRLMALTCLPAAGIVACGPDRPPPADLGEEGGEGGVVVRHTGGSPTGGTAGAASTAGAAGHAGEAAAGAPPTGGSAGSAGSAGAPNLAGAAPTGGTSGLICGNDAVDPGEDCDGEQLADATCESLGYDTGDLACADCRFDTSGCSGTEDCFDARDNDGDGDVDCGDSDCVDACSSLCAFAPTLDDPSTVRGDTTGHTSATSASCRGDEAAGGAGPGLSGREVAYRVVPSQDGVLEASLVSDDAELTVSVRSSCESGPELGCGLGYPVLVPVTQGEAVYVVVDGVRVDDVGGFELSVRTRAVVCGDGAIDPGEECDDGGMVPGDGCDDACQVESSETNPQGNDTPQSADDYVDPFYGRISTDDPVDFIQVHVPASSTLRARTLDLGNDACVNGELDSMVEILDGDGTTVLAFNDDFGGTLCSEAVAEGLAADTYYVRVTAAATGNTPVFPYRLEILIE